MPFLIPLVVAAVEAVGAAVAAVGSAIATGVGAIVETVGAVATGIADTVAAAAAPIMESVGAATETVTSAFASGMAPEAVIEATIPGGMSTVGEVTGAIATEGAVGGGMTAADVAAATAAEFGGSTGGLGTMGSTAAGAGGMTAADVAAATAAEFGGSTGGLGTMGSGSSILSDIGTGALKGAATNAISSAVTGREITPESLLTGAALGGLGAGVSSGLNTINPGSPIINKALTGAAVGGTGAALTGGDVGVGILTGGGVGAVSPLVSNMVDTGSSVADKALSSALVSGAKSALTGGDVATSALMGAGSGLINSGVNAATSAIKDALTSTTDTAATSAPSTAADVAAATQAEFGGSTGGLGTMEPATTANTTPIANGTGGLDAISKTTDTVVNQPGGLSEIRTSADLAKQYTNLPPVAQQTYDDLVKSGLDPYQAMDQTNADVAEVNRQLAEEAQTTGKTDWVDLNGVRHIIVTGAGDAEVATAPLGGIFGFGDSDPNATYSALFGGATGNVSAPGIFATGTSQQQEDAIAWADEKLADPNVAPQEKIAAQNIKDAASQSQDAATTKTAAAQGSAGEAGSAADASTLTAVQLANQKAYENAVASGDQNLVNEVLAGNTKIIAALAKDIPDIKTATSLYEATPWGEGAKSEAAPWGEWMAGQTTPLSIAALSAAPVSSNASGLSSTNGVVTGTGADTGTGTATTGTGAGTGTATAGTGTGTGTSGTGTGSGTSGSGSGSGAGIATAGITGSTLPTYAMAPLDFTGHVSHGQQIDLQGEPVFQEEMTRMEAKTGGLVSHFAAGGTTGSDITDYESWLTSATGKGSSQPRTTRGQNIQLIGTPTFTPHVYAEGGDVQHHSPHFNRGHKERLAAMLTGLPMAKMVDLGFPQFAEGGDVGGHNPEFYSTGGLNSLENTYVNGSGDGTSDSVAAMLADGEFVIPADIVSGLGNGSNKAGAEVLDEFMRVIREHKQKHDPKKLPPNSKGPKAYLLQAEKNLGKKK